MAAIAFDPLEYARALESSGVSREQAEVHAKAMTQVFVHNMDALVTRDYLDTRFTEFETRLEAKLDAKMERRFAEMDVRFARINVLLGVILVAVAIPMLQTLLTWVS